MPASSFVCSALAIVASLSRDDAVRVTNPVEHQAEFGRPHWGTLGCEKGHWFRSNDTNGNVSVRVFPEPNIEVESLGRIKSLPKWLEQASSFQSTVGGDHLAGWTRLTQDQRHEMIQNLPVGEFLCSPKHEKYFLEHPEIVTGGLLGKNGVPVYNASTLGEMMVSTKDESPSQFLLNIVGGPNGQGGINFVAINNMDGNRRAVMVHVARMLANQAQQSSPLYGLIEQPRHDDAFSLHQQPITCGLLKKVTGHVHCDVLINGYADEIRQWDRYEAWIPKDTVFNSMTAERLVSVFANLNLVDEVGGDKISVALQPDIAYSDEIFHPDYRGRPIDHVAELIVTRLSKRI